MAPTCSGWSTGVADLPAWVSEIGIPCFSQKVEQRALGLGIEHAAAADDQRLLGAVERRDRVGKFARIGRRAAGMVDAFGEEGFGVVVRLGLDVLAEGERHGPAFRRVGQYAHRPGQCGNDLLRTRDAVEIARNGAEAIVGADRAVAKTLDLLQDGIRNAIGEHVARQQQHGQPIDVGDGGGGHHVGRAGPDRARAGHHATAPGRLGEGDRRERHRLLVVRPIGRQDFARGVQGFAHRRDVAVPENREYAREQRNLPAVDFGRLRREETNGRLRGGETDGLHGLPLS